jgi:hypothetical protein
MWLSQSQILNVKTGAIVILLEVGEKNSLHPFSIAYELFLQSCGRIAQWIVIYFGLQCTMDHMVLETEL